MKNVIKYKDFIGSVHYSAEDEVFYGKLEGIDDLIMFEGKSVEELQNSFADAVEDYTEICKDTGKPLYKAYKGSFNIRIKPELHRKAAMKSTEMGISLNQLVEKAIKDILNERDHKTTHPNG
ncbi:MAG: type II toxin-antitoxin system HicB family antitoxin [Bacteroidales bacterium]|nr:type II toxin-antitoxin system HicB family antitoxin [Bacteroidales bacterium]